MVAGVSSYGRRWQCPQNGCTIACWDGSTSTPADQETRQKRHECHEAFDPLWQNKEVFPSRNQAYKWLKRTMPQAHHIGYMTAEQCNALISHIERLTTNGEKNK